MPHALGDAARRAPAALLALALGCGPSLSTLAQQGQIPQAWSRACARAGRVRVERDALTFPERAALRRAFAAAFDVVCSVPDAHASISFAKSSPT